MDQEFYFEESNPKKAKLIAAILLIVISLFFVGLLKLRSLYTLNLKKGLEFEVGTKISYDVTDYVTNRIVDENDYTLLFSAITMEDDVLNKIGEYTFKVKYKNVTKSGKLTVIDTVKPNVEVQDLTVGVNEEFLLDDFITKCEDYSLPCDVTYEDKKDEDNYKKEGSYKFNIFISDAAGNKVKKSVNLTVKKGYNYTQTKESDLKIDHIEPEYSDWDKSMILKFSKGYDPNDIDDTDVYGDLMDISGGDLHRYLDPMYENNRIEESQIIFVYNKYGLVIGFAIRVELDNGLSFYLKNN